MFPSCLYTLFSFRQNSPLLRLVPKFQAPAVATLSKVKARDTSKGKDTPTTHGSPIKAELSSSEEPKVQNLVSVSKDALPLPVRSSFGSWNAMSDVEIEAFRTRLVGEVQSAVASLTRSVGEWVEVQGQRMPALEEIVNSGARSHVQSQAAGIEKLESIRMDLGEMPEVIKEKQSVDLEPCDGDRREHPTSERTVSRASLSVKDEESTSSSSDADSRPLPGRPWPPPPPGMPVPGHMHHGMPDHHVALGPGCESTYSSWLGGAKRRQEPQIVIPRDDSP
jgi:hypothetical protein